ncbi:MAG: thioredoxin-dependent thiol peroxidase [Chloroflexi bacterium]|nr:thioredoxin-dependent thiol peroxidase [Chloroflexota bacterium]MDA1002099.1 thioredoxin-dependent thiol peroxidase [Chloroflexota bacterium]
MAVTLEAGDVAPLFSLPDQDGTTHRLADYAGLIVVVYFYPKDETPGCTTQACSIRDEYDDIRATGAVIFGVSTDDAESHRAFREHHGLPFPLLVDTEARMATAYGAWGEKTLYGRKSIGMTRSTFIIGGDGRLLRVWKRAKAADHGAVVVKALATLATK